MTFTKTTHALASRRLRLVGLTIFCTLANRAIVASPIWPALASACQYIADALLGPHAVVFTSTKSAINAKISYFANTSAIFALTMRIAR